MIGIHHPAFGLASGFLWKRAGEQRPVQDGQLHFPRMNGNGDREGAGVLTIHHVVIELLVFVEQHSYEQC